MLMVLRGDPEAAECIVPFSAWFSNWLSCCFPWLRLATAFVFDLFQVGLKAGSATLLGRQSRAAVLRALDT
jgi:hypothetical protein